MKRNIISLITALIATFALIAAQPTSTNYHVSCGSLRYYPAYQSRYVTPRNVVVWLPDGYSTAIRYDVIYMHDGQMLFDATTTWNHQEWQVDENICNLISRDEIRPCIVVAIDNTDNRITEYFPQKTVQYLSKKDLQGIHTSIFTADAYLLFIVNELKPFIDSNYSTLTDPAHTFTLGSSMGGLISLYALCEYPHVFGGAACLSTHLSMLLPQPEGSPAFRNQPWAEAFRKYLNKHFPAPNAKLIYMDRGTVELDGSYAPYQDAVTRLLIGKGWDQDHFTVRTFIGHRHMETYWAQRLSVPLTFLLHKN